MILYDDKQNFLGMSSHTLSFLGYEDIGDFLSLHNDFANLFVNQEGYIYKFDNFSWIDFVLFSGSANKSAIITLKNGQDTQVDLSIKEVHLAHPLNGINKLYSVKIISDNFHKISGVPKSDEGISSFSLSGITKDELSIEVDTKEDIANHKTNTFSLNGLIDNNIAIDEKTKIEAPKDDFLQLAEENKEEEDKKNESFILNIPEDEPSFKENSESIILEDKTTDSIPVEDFKLDFSKVQKESNNDDTEQSSDFTLQLESETKPEEHKSTLESFLLQDDTEENVEIKNEEKSLTTTQTKDVTELFDFDLLKTDDKSDNIEKTVEHEKEEEQIDEIKLDFISKEDNKPKDIQETNDSGFKLDFLKINIDDEPKEEEHQESINEHQDELVSSEVFEIKQKSEQIIQQIKDDIKEIDAEYKNTNSTLSEERVDETFSLNIEESITEHDVEQTLQMKDNEISSKEEVMSNFQIDESKSVSANRSFTNTLKGLFGNTSSKTDELKKVSSLDQEIKDDAFSFTLKNSNDNENTKVEEELNEADAQLKHQEEARPIEDKEQEFQLSSLSSLGLDPEDEFDLLTDFISDAKDSIETIEQFIQTNDFDKINYALVKIKSSAEILKLDAIIENSNNLRKHCITEDSEKVTIDTQKLKENIKLLERHLEAAAI